MGVEWSLHSRGQIWSGGDEIGVSGMLSEDHFSESTLKGNTTVFLEGPGKAVAPLNPKHTESKTQNHKVCLCLSESHLIQKSN